MEEQNLIFIISQPRSGSTVLQKLLSNNDYVATSSEPWLLLRYIPILEPALIKAEFNFRSTHEASADFISQYDHPILEKTKSEILGIYRLAAKQSQFFLDKTPRYYEILDTIYDLFPNAKFVILKRHPGAVLNSMLSTWSRGKIDFAQIHTYHRDFCVAPRRILEFEQKHLNKKNVCTVYYENLVDDPFSSSKFLYDWIGIPFFEQTLNIEKNNKTKGIFGDDVYDTERPKKYSTELVNDSVNKWMGKETDGEIYNFIVGYLQWLGRDFIEFYGYRSDFPKLLKGHYDSYPHYLSYSKTYRFMDVKWNDFLSSKFQKFFNKLKGHM